LPVDRTPGSNPDHTTAIFPGASDFNATSTRGILLNHCRVSPAKLLHLLNISEQPASHSFLQRLLGTGHCQVTAARRAAHYLFNGLRRHPRSPSTGGTMQIHDRLLSDCLAVPKIT
jgi:hypothetical protein